MFGFVEISPETLWVIQQEKKPKAKLALGCLCEKSLFTNHVSWLSDPRLKKGQIHYRISGTNF